MSTKAHGAYLNCIFRGIMAKLQRERERERESESERERDRDFIIFFLFYFPWYFHTEFFFENKLR